MEQKNFPFALKSATLVLAMSALLTGCGGDKKNDPKQLNSSLVAKSVVAPGATCPTGGVTLYSGVDENGDGTLQESERDTSDTICNGSDGSSAAAILIEKEPLSAGVACPTGGVTVYFGTDTNGDGLLQTTEQTINHVLCNGFTGVSASPVVEFESDSYSVEAGSELNIQTIVYDVNGDKDFTYSIKTRPDQGVTSISTTGKINYITATGSDAIGDYSIEIEVSDGTEAEPKTATINITVTEPQVDAPVVDRASFKNQFYKTANTNTGNSQIVHYDSETGLQQVIKTDVILGSKVFVMSGTTSNDKTTYQKREYGIFLDPSALKEAREGTDRYGRPFNYDFYYDHILKAFSADNTANERTIIKSDNLKQNLKSAGLNVLDGGYQLLLNQDDITNSYAQITAYGALADAQQGDDPNAELQVPLTVRLSDGNHVEGRILSILKNNDHSTREVLVNFIAPHRKNDAYPSGDANKKRLQTCSVDLASCSDIEDGDFYKLAENTTHIYLTKHDSATIFAFNKSNKELANVTGVTYPAKFDNKHHNNKLISTGGHSSGVFSNFWNLVDSKDTLAEGDIAYVSINYNLDTEDKISVGPYDQYGMFMKGHKNSMILKLTGTEGIKVYENGTGVDLMNESDDIPVSFHTGLIAVKNGSIALEAAQIVGGATCGDDKNCMKYRQAWLNTDGQTATKTEFDNAVVAEDLKYLTGFRSTPKAVADSIYFTMRTGIPVGHGGTGTLYNVWKLPMDDSSKGKDDAEHVLGRMLFERTAFRTTGVYDGTVILWDSNSGDIKDATNNKVLGNDNLAEVNSEVVESVTGVSGSNNLTGVGGIFGLKLGINHGAKSVLTAGEVNSTNSLKVVNEISGQWITE